MSTPGKNPSPPNLDSDDDDLPLLARRNSSAPPKQPPQARSVEEEAEDTSDDDKPLIAKIAKPKATAKKKTKPAAPKARAKSTTASPRVKRCKAEPSPSPKAARKRTGPNGDGGSQSDLDEEEQPNVFKEGQIKVCPPLGDAQRAFYESLLAENARSIIAIKYCVEQGVLIGTQAKAGYAQYKILKDAGAFKLLGGVKPEMIAQLE